VNVNVIVNLSNLFTLTAAILCAKVEPLMAARVGVAHGLILSLPIKTNGDETEDDNLPGTQYRLIMLPLKQA